MGKEAITLPQDERASLLLSVPAKVMMSDEGVFQTSPYKAQEGKVITTWDVDTPEDWEKSEYALTRADVAPGGYREVEMGNRKSRKWLIYTAENVQRTLKLVADPAGEVHLFSLFLHAQAGDAQPASCAFDYRNTAELDTVRLMLSPVRAFAGSERTAFEDAKNYYSTRPFSENLRECAQIFNTRKADIQARNLIEDPEEEDEKRVLNGSICKLGFPEVIADIVREQVQAMIVEEVTEAVGDVLDPELLPYFVRELMSPTISLITESEKESPRFRLDPIRRAEVLKGMADFIQTELILKAQRLALQSPTHVEIEFLTDSKDEVRYTVIEQGPTLSQKRVVCTEDKVEGESFRFETYEIECHSVGSNVMVDVGNIRDSGIKRFIGPHEVDLLKFYDKVSSPFSSGIEAADTVSGMYVKVK